MTPEVLSETLPVIIVGAGIVGLTLAQFFKQNRIPFEIYERDASLLSSPGGWGLTIHWALPSLRYCLPPSIFSRLESIQVDPTQGGNNDTGKFLFLNLKTGEPKFVIPPAERLRIVRRKFREMLTEGVDVKWDKAITSFETVENQGDEGYVSVSFSDGTTKKGRLLVGTDGSSSRTRRFLLGNEKAKLNELPVRLLGVTVRMTPAQIKPLRDIDPLLFSGGHPDTGAFLWYSMQSTPETNGSIDKKGGEYYEGQLIFSWLAKNPKDEAPTDPRAKLKKMRDLAESCETRLRQAVMEIPDDADPMVLRPTDWPTQRWDNHNGLVTLMGDAAHPMTMYRGEGLNHGLTDAANLGALILQVYEGKLDMKEAIDRYEAEMQIRGYDAVLLSRQACLEAHDIDRLTVDSPLVSKRAKVLEPGRMVN